MPEGRARRTDDMTLFLAPMDRSAVEIRPIAKMGRHAAGSDEVFIDGLRVPADHRFGEEGAGFRHLLDGLDPERILLAHESVGIGRAAVRRAVAHANERVFFDRATGQNQGIAFARLMRIAPISQEMVLNDVSEHVLGLPRSY